MPRWGRGPLSACVFRAGRAIAGDRPPRYGMRAVFSLRRARACPSPCLDRGKGLGWRAFFARVERSRGTGPRATVKNVLLLVGRGPVPRRASVRERPWLACGFRGGRTLAGDRPPRYGMRAVFSLRRARACPSPCPRARDDSRGTGPRATVKNVRFSPLRFPFSLALNHNF